MQVKCARPKCMCVVPGEKEYCSEWCRKNLRDEMVPCSCGHATCEQIYKRKVAKSTTPASA